jgi:hypothetical protein
MDVRAKQRLCLSVVRYPLLVWRRFRPTSSQPLDASCLKHKATADLKTKEIRSAFHAKLRVVEQRAEDEDASNKSLDVRQKQRLCLNLLLFHHVVRIRFLPTLSQPLAVSWWQSTLVTFECVLKNLSVEPFFGIASGLTGKAKGFVFAKLFNRKRTMKLCAVFSPRRTPRRAPRSSSAPNSDDAAFVV